VLREMIKSTKSMVKAKDVDLVRLKRKLTDGGMLQPQMSHLEEEKINLEVAKAANAKSRNYGNFVSRQNVSLKQMKAGSSQGLKKQLSPISNSGSTDKLRKEEKQEEQDPNSSLLSKDAPPVHSFLILRF
jgi:hypothetical protein